MPNNHNLDFETLSDHELIDSLRAIKTGGSLLEEAAARILEYLSLEILDDQMQGATSSLDKYSGKLIKTLFKKKRNASI